MPFQSARQRRYLYAHDPDVARQFARHTPQGQSRPERHVQQQKDQRTDLVVTNLVGLLKGDQENS